jgi:hypothetical protein
VLYLVIMGFSEASPENSIYDAQDKGTDSLSKENLTEITQYDGYNSGPWAINGTGHFAERLI